MCNKEGIFFALCLQWKRKWVIEKTNYVMRRCLRIHIKIRRLYRTSRSHHSFILSIWLVNERSENGVKIKALLNQGQFTPALAWRIGLLKGFRTRLERITWGSLATPSPKERSSKDCSAFNPHRQLYWQESVKNTGVSWVWNGKLKRLFSLNDLCVVINQCSLRVSYNAILIGQPRAYLM